MNVPLGLDECSVRGQTNVPLDECSVRRIFCRRKCRFPYIYILYICISGGGWSIVAPGTENKCNVKTCMYMFIYICLYIALNAYVCIYMSLHCTYCIHTISAMFIHIYIYICNKCNVKTCRSYCSPDWNFYALIMLFRTGTA